MDFTLVIGFFYVDPDNFIVTFQSIDKAAPNSPEDPVIIIFSFSIEATVFKILFTFYEL